VETHGLRLENSRIVHRPGTSRDRYGVELPAPECQTPIGGWDPRRLCASQEPVNCRRCLKRGSGHAAAAQGVALELF